MTLFARRPDEITREPVQVMLASCADELSSIQELWPWFEMRVGLRGRKMYGAADLLAGTYTTCTPIRPDDEPAALGLEVGELSAGTYRRGRLLGDAGARQPASMSAAADGDRRRFSSRAHAERGLPGAP